MEEIKGIELMPHQRDVCHGHASPLPTHNHECKCPALRKASVSNYQDYGTEK